METLFAKYFKKLEYTPTAFVRDILQEIDWKDRMVGIKGARGVGKTTLLLQYAKTELAKTDKSLYASLDDLYFKRTGLYELAGRFHREGGNLLLLDEVHRYPGWSQELKNIYDDFPELRVVFTGSSLIHLSRGTADLSRRAVLYTLSGLSFREFLRLREGFASPRLSLRDLIDDHTSLALSIQKKVKPLAHFQDYLRLGYHPYFLENPDTYPQKLAETVNLMLDTDLPSAYGITYATVDKLKLFLAILAESVPFTPNIQKLAEHLGVSRNTVIEYLHYLDEAGLIGLLHREGKGVTRLQKPDKIYLANTNLAFALDSRQPNRGSLRETFFFSQLRPRHRIAYSPKGDFVVDNQYFFEVGGADKGFAQLPAQAAGFVAADDLDVGYGRKIPLWLFGFLD